jgi:hypothetical protein
MADHQVNILLKARDDASRKLSGLAKTAIGLGAAFLSFRAIAGFVRSSTAAFMEQEKAANSLSNALALVGAQTQMRDMEKFAAQIQKVTIHGDEAVMQVMALGASMGKLSGEDLKNATTAAIGLSKAFNMDLNTAMTLISKAAQGNTASMSRYGITFKEGMTAQEKFNQVLTIGREKFALARGETATFAGQLQQLKNAFGDAKEQMGAMIGQSTVMMNVIRVLKVSFENFGTTMQLIWTQLKLGFVEMFEQAKYNFSVTVEYLKWLGDNWKQVFQTIWSFTKSVLSGMFANLKNFFVAVWSWLKGEGFDFKWTGLLEGFESTLSALPKIADRQLGALEEELAGKRDELAMRLGTAIGLDMGGTGGTVGTGGGFGGSAGGGIAGAAGKVAAVESRFLGGGGRSPVDVAQEGNRLSRRQIDLLAAIERQLGRLGDMKNGFVAAYDETKFS